MKLVEVCEDVLERECGGKAFLTPSCTAALELACMMVIKPGDEVIMPSWTFPSTASAVIRQGGIPVFVDVDRNLNMDPNHITMALTPRTKAIMPIHYAGVVAQMDKINDIAQMYGLYVIEDAAQAIGNWKVTGDFGCLSFHSTKNVQCGEGGALIVKNPAFIEKAEILRDCGTTKAKYKRGETSGYDFLEVGSSYLMSEYAAVKLLEELQILPEITARRRKIWNLYHEALHSEGTLGNGHIFWMMVDNKWEWLKGKKHVSSHYDALHSTLPGRKYGRAGSPIIRSTEAMLRLVKLNTGISEQDACESIDSILKSRKNSKSSLNSPQGQNQSSKSEADTVIT